MNGITKNEEVKFQRLIGIVRKSKMAYEAAGSALTTIRDEKLYRGIYETFEECCEKEFGYKKTHAYRLIEAAAVVAEMSETSPLGDMPKTERVARELEKVAPEDRGAVMAIAKRNSKDGEVTAKDIKKEAELTSNAKTGFKEKPKTPDIMVDAELDSARARIASQEALALLDELIEICQTPAGAHAQPIQFTHLRDSLKSYVKDFVPHCICVYCGGKKCKACSQAGWMTRFEFNRSPEEMRKGK